MDKKKMICIPISMILGAGAGALLHQTLFGLAFGIAIGVVLSFKKEK